MPQPTRGDGPWAAAIDYWLREKGWLQADLVRRIEELGEKTGKNTVSSATNGRDVNTRSLRIIAQAFGVPLAAVLVSPEQLRAGEEMQRTIQAAVSAALAGLRARNVLPPLGYDAILEEMKVHSRTLEPREARPVPVRRESVRKKNPPKRRK